MKNRQEILEIYLNILEQKREQAQKNLEGSIEDSREAEGAMQSRYSTFKEEAQYLGQGHYLRVQRFDELIGNIKKIINSLPTLKQNKDNVALLSFVEILFLDTDDKGIYLLIPGEGHELVDNIHILGISTPLGIQLLNKQIGDEYVLKLPKNSKEIEILNIY